MLEVFHASLPSVLNGHYWPILLCVIALCALVLDRLVGEVSRFHPLIAFGRWAHALEQALNRRAATARRERFLGVVALLLALLPLLPIMVLMYVLAVQSFWLWLAAQVLVLYVCLGWQSLKEHVQAVFIALLPGHLSEARRQLSKIVSRDTQELTENEVAQATVETLLENTSDAVVASLFWFAIGGAVAALMHRWVNTLDAMWGYKNPRFIHFGWAAARLDDILAYWPARLTALLFLLSSGRRMKQTWQCWRAQARRCASPNGGVVMTAGAGALGVRLSERACYLGEWKAKPLMGCGEAARAQDIVRATALIQRSLGLLLLIWGAVALCL